MNEEKPVKKNDDSDDEGSSRRTVNHFSASHVSCGSSSNDESGDDDLHLTQQTTSSAVSNHLPLIPSDCADVQEAQENFLRVFEARYGDRHPFFTPINLPDVVKDLQQSHYSQRKPVLLYLHDDNSVLSQVCCTQVLCDPAMTEFVNSNFLFWAWDLTVAENRTKVIEWLQTALGHQITLRLRVCTHDDFPVLMVLGKISGSVEMVALIKGACLLEQAMAELMSALDVCNDQIKVDSSEEAERLLREKVRTEQDHAFKESLEADKLKTQMKLDAEKRKDNENQRRLAFELQKEEDRQRIEAGLAPEPPENCGEPHTTLRIRAVNGENLERRFLLGQRLSNLFDFVASKNFAIVDYKLLTNFPRRDLTSLDATKTFKELNFGPREAINLEAR